MNKETLNTDPMMSDGTLSSPGGSIRRKSTQVKFWVEEIAVVGAYTSHKTSIDSNCFTMLWVPSNFSTGYFS